MSKKTATSKSDILRLKLLVENYYNAIVVGQTKSYWIKTVLEDNYEEYYILIQPTAGIYKGQRHVLEFKTTYGRNDSIVYQYPMTFPKVRFLTKIYHTNINVDGTICLDILKDDTKWVPSYDFNAVIFNILLLLQNPNNSSAFNPTASSDYMKCESVYLEQIKQQTLSVEEEEAAFMSAFQPFIKLANKYANSDLKPYYSFFPQLTADEQLANDILAAEVASLKELVDNFKQKLKKSSSKTDCADDKTKPVNNTVVIAKETPTETTNVVINTNAAASTNTATTTNTAASTNTTANTASGTDITANTASGTDTTAKKPNPKWAKYVKK